MEFIKLDDEIIGFYLLPLTLYLAKTSLFCTRRTHIKQAKENIAVKDWQLDAREVAELDRAAEGVDKPMVQNIF